MRNLLLKIARPFQFCEKPQIGSHHRERFFKISFGAPQGNASVFSIGGNDMRSAIFCAFGILLSPFLGVELATAQDVYPSKPIRLVVTTAAGGAGDLVARAVGDRLSESLQQPIIIENQPAGNGGIAAGQVAKAAPDGYTLTLMVDSTLTTNPHLFKKLPYDAFADFAPISVISQLHLVLAVNADLKAQNVRELIALAKANPGKLSFASTGLGTQPHTGMELFKLMTKTDILHVPYRATTNAMTDLIGGRIDMILIGRVSAQAQADSGKARLLGIASPQRSPADPGLKTISEEGVPGYEVSSWFGLLAPAKTPKEIVDRLSREVKKASADPRFIAMLAPQGMEIVASSPEEMTAMMKSTSKKWGDVIAATGMTINQ